MFKINRHTKLFRNVGGSAPGAEKWEEIPLDLTPAQFDADDAQPDEQPLDDFFLVTIPPRNSYPPAGTP